MHRRWANEPQASFGPTQSAQTDAPQTIPVGFRVHAREVEVGVPAMQAPAAEQVLLVMEPASVPLSEQV